LADCRKKYTKTAQFGTRRRFGESVEENSRKDAKVQRNTGQPESASSPPKLVQALVKFPSSLRLCVFA
jgi:hypothetical protein